MPMGAGKIKSLLVKSKGGPSHQKMSQVGALGKARMVKCILCHLVFSDHPWSTPLRNSPQRERSCKKCAKLGAFQAPSP